jgi:hypothetical protein
MILLLDTPATSNERLVRMRILDGQSRTGLPLTDYGVKGRLIFNAVF